MLLDNICTRKLGMAKSKQPLKTSNEAWLLLENQLCFKLYSASKSMTTAYRSLLIPLDLTYPQYLVMLVLWDKDNISVKELGLSVGLDSGTLSPLLKKLQAKKIVMKSREQNDERIITLKLTKTGLDLKKEAMKIPAELMKKIGLNITEISELRKRLDVLVNNLEGAIS